MHIHMYNQTLMWCYYSFNFKFAIHASMRPVSKVDLGRSRHASVPLKRASTKHDGR